MRWIFLLFAGVGVVGSGCVEKGSEPSPALSGTGDNVHFDTPFSDPNDTMPESLAQTGGISIQEARQRLVLQHEVSILAEHLRKKYGERFAGAAIEPEPTFLAKYYFVGVNLVEARAALSTFGVSADLLPLIRLEAVAGTEAQMRAKAVRMREQLLEQHIDGSVAVGIMGYKITTLQVEEAAEALRLGSVEGGNAVVIERSAPVLIFTN